MDGKPASPNGSITEMESRRSLGHLRVLCVSFSQVVAAWLGLYQYWLSVSSRVGKGVTLFSQSRVSDGFSTLVSCSGFSRDICFYNPSSPQ